MGAATPTGTPPSAAHAQLTTRPGPGPAKQAGVAATARAQAQPAAVVAVVQGEAAVAAALVGLCLDEVPLPAAPSPGATAEAAAAAEAALQEAAIGACEGALRTAEALRLPPERVDAVCGGVQAATEEAVACRRFLGMEYPRLQRACAAGAVEVVRAWMDRTAALSS
jgi:hypothetical protein